MFYGLSIMEEEYFANKVNKFIAMAPCIYYNQAAFYEDASYDEIVDNHETYEANSIEYLNTVEGYDMEFEKKSI